MEPQANEKNVETHIELEGYLESTDIHSPIFYDMQLITTSSNRLENPEKSWFLISDIAVYF